MSMNGTMRFSITAETLKRVSLEDWILLERWIYEGETRVSALVGLAAQALVDEQGQAIPPEQARKLLGKKSIADLSEIGIALMTALKEALIPPANGNGSS